MQYMPCLIFVLALCSFTTARGHHIQAWLNGVKTIDVVHEKGFANGAIGFQLCHGKKETIVDVKTLLIKELGK